MPPKKKPPDPQNTTQGVTDSDGVDPADATCDGGAAGVEGADPPGRDGEQDESGNQKVSLKKVVAESYLENVTKEVEMLINRHKQYKTRLANLDPTLRARCQSRAIDDIFDAEMLPGDRWTKPQ